MVVVNNTVPPQLVTTTGSTIGRLLPGQGHLLHYLVTTTGGTIGRLKPGQGHLLRFATARTQSNILLSGDDHWWQHRLFTARPGASTSEHTKQHIEVALPHCLQT